MAKTVTQPNPGKTSNVTAFATTPAMILARGAASLVTGKVAQIYSSNILPSLYAQYTKISAVKAAGRRELN